MEKSGSEQSGVYFGEAHTALDDKGRITVPRRIRDTMEVMGHIQWYMTRGFDGAIFLFPKEEWDKIRSLTSQFPSMDTHALDFRRMFLGSAAVARPDRQGRMLVPQYLRDHASIEKEAVLVGVEDHLELWSAAGWTAYQKKQEETFKEMASELFQGDRDSGLSIMG